MNWKYWVNHSTFWAALIIAITGFAVTGAQTKTDCPVLYDSQMMISGAGSAVVIGYLAMFWMQAGGKLSNYANFMGKNGKDSGSIHTLPLFFLAAFSLIGPLIMLATPHIRWGTCEGVNVFNVVESVYGGLVFVFALLWVLVH